MKRVLIDECLPTALHRAFPQFEVRTVARMRWQGRSDAQLLDLADGAFDVVLTADRSIPHQQRLDGRSFGIVIVSSTVWTDLRSDLDAIGKAIAGAAPGTAVIVPRVDPRPRPA